MTGPSDLPVGYGVDLKVLVPNKENAGKIVLTFYEKNHIIICTTASIKSHSTFFHWKSQQFYVV